MEGHHHQRIRYGAVAGNRGRGIRPEGGHPCPSQVASLFVLLRISLAVTIRAGFCKADQKAYIL